MTRFTTTIVLACLLAIPARADNCPIRTLYPDVDGQGNCISLKCFGWREIREAYRRGEITSVHLHKQSDCEAVRNFDPSNGDRLSVPCTFDVWDQGKPFSPLP